jgi:anhydro-N-acetylmuramic acid kinase
VDNGCDFCCQYFLRLVDLVAAKGCDAGNFGKRQACEDFQKALDIAILAIAPILPEIIGGKNVAVQPDSPVGRLAHFRAGRGCQKWGRQSKELACAHAVAKVDAIDNIAPLVRAAHLQDAVVTLVEFNEIIALKNHIVEFKERQGLLAVKARLDTVEGQHAVDGKVTTDIAQEFQIVELCQPVGIVDHDSGIFAFIVENIAVDSLDTGNIGVDLLNTEQLPLIVAKRRVTHHRCAAAHQADGLVAGFLEPIEHGDGDEIADMDAGSRCVIADIGRHSFLLEQCIQTGFIGNLVDEPAFFEGVKEFGLETGHDLSLSAGYDVVKSRRSSIVFQGLHRIFEENVMGTVKTAIGLMSGTSMDGIDIALLRTDGERRVERGPGASFAYDAAFRNRLKQALEIAKTIQTRDQRPGDLSDIERELTLRHVDAVHKFLNDNNFLPENIDVIGFHGQTVLHRPHAALTVQIGDGQSLASKTGIDVVYDMRANDMVHGGQGAPLVPAYHAALANHLRGDDFPAVFVNIGGISNLTYIGSSGEILAFDSGPGNTLIDQWVEAHAGIPFDQGGMIASEGQVLDDLAASYLCQPFFTDPVRRSLDRNDFRPPTGGQASLEDGARTLAHVAAAAILRSARHFPKPARTYVICGGGRLNKMIMQDLDSLAAKDCSQVLTAEALALDGDTMEAEAWAYLAVRALKGLPLTFPGTTGVSRPVTGGVLARKTL